MYTVAACWIGLGSLFLLELCCGREVAGLGRDWCLQTYAASSVVKLYVMAQVHARVSKEGCTRVQICGGT